MRLHFYTTLSLLAVCLASSGAATAQSAPKKLDIEKAIDNKKEIDLSDIAGDITFVPLQIAGEESLIDGNITAVAESKNYYYVYDSNVRPIKVFDKSGKFVATRGVFGRGPGELLIIHHGVIVTDHERDNLYLKVDNSLGEKTMLAYNSAGRVFARTTALENALDVSWSGGKIVLLNNLQQDRYPDLAVGDPITLLEIFSPDLKPDPGGTVRSTYKGPVRKKTTEGDGFFSYPGAFNILSGNGRTLLVKEARSNTVNYYENGALRPAYELDMGGYTVPEKAFGENTPVELGKNYAVYQIYEGDKYLILDAAGFDGMPKLHLVIDRSDPSGGFAVTGPGRKPGLFIDGIAFTPMYIRDNRLVGYMQAIDIADNAAAIKNPRLKSLAANLDETDNPVIVVATLKK